MDGYGRACEVEKAGMVDLIPYGKRRFGPAEFVMTTDHPFIQKFLGDAVARRPGGRAKAIEIKCERKHTGNLFLETWSNRSRRTRGWLDVSNADLLWYYFLDTGLLYEMPMAPLRSFVFGRQFSFRETEQRTHEQLNDTWGLIVPVTQIKQNVPDFFELHPREDGESLRQGSLLAS